MDNLSKLYAEAKIVKYIAKYKTFIFLEFRAETSE